MNNYLEKRKRLFVTPKNSALFGACGGVLREYIRRMTTDMLQFGGSSEHIQLEIFEEETKPVVGRVDADSFAFTSYETEDGQTYPISLELGSWISTLLHPTDKFNDYDELDSWTFLHASIKNAILSATLLYFETHWGDKYELLKDSSGFWYVSAK